MTDSNAVDAASKRLRWRWMRWQPQSSGGTIPTAVTPRLVEQPMRSAPTVPN